MAVDGDKASLLQALIERVEQDLARSSVAQRDVQSGATHEEARPENDKDTRALEATYLARGLAGRVATLEHALGRLQRMKVRTFDADAPIALSALVTLEDVDTGRSRTYFITPASGGLALDCGGASVLTVTPDAPLGRSLIGARLGDQVQVRTPQGLREMEITQVL